MDLDIYEHDTLNTTMMVVLQVYFIHEYMLEIGPLMHENHVKKSQSYVASPHLPRLREGALHLIPNFVLYVFSFQIYIRLLSITSSF